LLSEEIGAIGEQAERAEQNKSKKAEEESAYRTGGKSVDRREYSRAGKKGPENRQAEGDNDE